MNLIKTMNKKQLINGVYVVIRRVVVGCDRREIWTSVQRRSGSNNCEGWLLLMLVLVHHAIVVFLSSVFFDYR